MKKGYYQLDKPVKNPKRDLRTGDWTKADTFRPGTYIVRTDVKLPRILLSGRKLGDYLSKGEPGWNTLAEHLVPLKTEPTLIDKLTMAELSIGNCYDIINGLIRLELIPPMDSDLLELANMTGTLPPNESDLVVELFNAEPNDLPLFIGKKITGEFDDAIFQQLLERRIKENT